MSRPAIALSAILLIVLTWVGTLDAMRVERHEASAHVAAEATNMALAFEDQLNRQLLAVDQTLRILEREWEADPRGFNLEQWRRRAVVLSDVSLHVAVTDAAGVITSSTRPELVGVDVSRRDYFRYERAKPADDNAMFISPATTGLVTRRWQMNMARRLDEPDGRFAGVLLLSYDTAALSNFLKEADLGPDGLIAVVGSKDGLLRAWIAAEEQNPGASIRNTPMFAAIEASPNGTWDGRSALDGVDRIHAFRQVGDRELEVIIGFARASALTSSAAWERGAIVFAVGITLFVALMAAGLLREMGLARRREHAMARDRAVLEEANAALETAMARADAKTAQLEATFAGMSDGVSMLDENLCLVQWNDKFAEFTGIPGDLPRVGLPMEEILRVQALAGEFGPVDVEAEVSRRMALLWAQSQVGTLERVRPNGMALELRRSALPGGGFVTLYTDITVRKQHEDALRRARELAEAATEAKSRFVAIVSHEIRTPLNTLLNSLVLLADTPMSPGQHRMVDMAAQSGEALLGLINDILEMSKMEAGRLGLRPNIFMLRPLLEGTLDMFRTPAAERQIRLELQSSIGVPDRIYADPGRLRQVLLNLLSNAVKFADPGLVTLEAETRFSGGRTVLRFGLRDEGPMIGEADRARLFQAFSQLDHGPGKATPGTGLGLAICERLVSLMGGDIGCESTAAGGNEFWFTLPITPLPSHVSVGSANVESGLPRRLLPRTRVLLVEDIPANQLITATLLRREGHLVDIASSGDEAIRAVGSLPYDLVLMDIFMPGMTGLEAARRIREMAGPARSVPIVALTANVSAEDRGRCLDAGMNGMLSKPVELSKLVGALADQVWPIGTPEGTDDVRARAERDDLPVLAADRLAELRDNLPPETLARLVDQCLAELRDRMDLLTENLAQGDIERIAAESHAIAGVAGSYAMAGLDRRLRRVMAAAGRKDLPAARAAALDLASEFARAEEALRDAMRAELV